MKWALITFGMMVVGVGIGMLVERRLLRPRRSLQHVRNYLDAQRRQRYRQDSRVPAAPKQKQP